jgi:hypothetical protein
MRSRERFGKAGPLKRPHQPVSVLHVVASSPARVRPGAHARSVERIRPLECGPLPDVGRARPWDQSRRLDLDPPREKHWHGATPTAGMVLLAMQVALHELDVLGRSR